MSVDQWLQFGIALPGVISLIGMGVIWFTRSTSKTEASDAVSPLRDDIDDIKGRVIALETKCKMCPNPEGVNELAVKVAEFGGELKAVKATLDAMGHEMKGMHAAVDRVNDYLLSRT